MKEKILLITTIYPSPDLNLLNNTNVCHYFALEWVKMGYEVKVIFNYPIYNSVLHFIASFFEKKIANVSSSYVATKRIAKDMRYTLDGVLIERYPIFKPFPRLKYPKKSIEKQIEKIIRSNKNDNFIPDIITGHFHYPSIELVQKLSNLYNATSCVVIHGNTDNLKYFYKKNYSELIRNINVWGYRSMAIQKIFEHNYGKQLKSFICNSGIPESFLSNNQGKEFYGHIKKFIFVGAFIKRKHPISLVQALSKVYSNKDFTINYIGDGAEKQKIIAAVKTLKVENNIFFSGHVSRNEVIRALDNSECFVMISEDETYGLVYLEAMAKGCITIASRNEGMDGIIRHGINGFLCEAGNSKELAEIIHNINLLSQDEKRIISYNAIVTAQNMTDEKMAKIYIDNLKTLSFKNA